MNIQDMLKSTWFQIVLTSVIQDGSPRLGSSEFDCCNLAVLFWNVFWSCNTNGMQLHYVSPMFHQFECECLDCFSMACENCLAINFNPSRHHRPRWRARGNVFDCKDFDCTNPVTLQHLRLWEKIWEELRWKDEKGVDSIQQSEWGDYKQSEYVRVGR